MSYTHLQPRQYYEGRYDDSTIDMCRDGERMVNSVFTKMQDELPADELKQRKAGWYLQYSFLYFSMVELTAAARQSEREEAISKWMKEDGETDQRLTEAHTSGKKYCLSCGKDMKIIDKHYMHREGRKEDDILLMFECEACSKRKAFWHDGTEWEGARIKCDKCGGDVNSAHKTEGKVVTTTMTCASCGHVKTDIMDFSKTASVEEEPSDPLHEVDRRRFIFGSDMMFKFEQKARHLERLRQLEDVAPDKEENIDIDEAVKDIKKLKIAQLSELLAAATAEKKYTEFKLGEPQLGREVYIEFSCLDAEPDREEQQSKKGLHELIDMLLLETNWRLMTGGVSYRLGYLNGRLRAYESEEDLKNLIEQRIKNGTLTPPKKEPARPKPPANQPQYEGMRLREAALVYMDKMTLGSVPAEITMKSGKKKSTGIPVISAEMNPLLRVLIPRRDNDDSVPEFVTTYDFKLGPGDDEIPKVSKDSLGREVRLLD